MILAIYMSKFKIASVSYLNSKPFLYGLKNYPFKSEIEYSVDTPANVSIKLFNGEVNLALVPVVVLSQLKQYYLLDEFCIGAKGPVQSVCLFSEKPIENCNSILLDYQSQTSVMLTKILMSKHWKLNLEFVSTEAGYEKEIKNETAGLVIGDRALKLKSKFKFVYDLGEEWMKLTGLPFVFAVWLSLNEIPGEIKSELVEAFQFGINSIDKVIAEEEFFFLGIDVENYLTNGIDYMFNDDKIRAMKLFLNYITEIEGAGV